MKKNNIKTDNVYFTNESNTGTACVMVDKNGNQISIYLSS